MTILKGLTLERAKGKNFLEKRFLKPISERLIKNYPDLQYEDDRQRGTLPENIQVVEFYLPAGKYLGNTQVQQNYISSNYTHASRDLIKPRSECSCSNGFK